MHPIPATINTKTAKKYTEPSTGKPVLAALLLVYADLLPKRSLDGAEVLIHFNAKE
uniref:Uncharacterized protein n=1 Tax=Siphoviridae sp. ctGkF2 TaxID=2827823 RepID=A0A8S5TMG9_9CAUD|nr:MAG TPA: hypothetical protein [Siphoviridae sp. ctGkF2]